MTLNQLAIEEAYNALETLAQTGKYWDASMRQILSEIREWVPCADSLKDLYDQLGDIWYDIFNYWADYEIGTALSGVAERYGVRLV